MWILLSRDDVVYIHDEVIGVQELQGLAKDKSLEGALARIDHKIQYGIIQDVYDLAAMYAMVLAQGHVFNDANKRTAYMAMHTCLAVNGVEVIFDGEEIGALIVKLAEGLIDERELADWLRKYRR